MTNTTNTAAQAAPVVAASELSNEQIAATAYSQFGIVADDQEIAAFARWVLAAATPAASEGWTVAAGEMPKGNVLASMRYPTGKRRTIVAFYAGKFQIECGCDDGVAFELNEEDDEFYLQEGWYECVQNWGDFSSVAVTEGAVTHHRPLPAAPTQAEGQGHD
ncbi:hypothetical protein [Pseudoduganella chitinolytica]|uniref:DUF551 domain-containing protein n=1 Tax=Pseudoduganella chitinolytica TaxID=34070 RepID=A0ABY8BG44_9BURK|nr:hypothetical protein [Pseudoduganella chitinolytica]WEF34907.1 hypothetical protein PX653_09145 [Pseudoduganella chitinolytica]